MNGSSDSLDAGFHVRQVFSDALLSQLLCAQPIMTVDRQSGITLSYRFNPHAGGQLMFTDGDLACPVSLGVDEGAINLVATIMLDGLKHQ